MKYKTIIDTSKSLLLWIYNAITKKFTTTFNKLRNKFPIINRYPLLKYSLIPLFIALFILLRYIIKLGVNELASWSSNFVGESSGYNLSERTIVLSFAAIFIMLRIGLQLMNRKKKKNIELDLNYESAK